MLLLGGEREGGRERGREGVRKGWREGGQSEEESHVDPVCTSVTVFIVATDHKVAIDGAISNVHVYKC